MTACMHEVLVGVDDGCVKTLKKLEPSYEDVFTRCQKCGAEVTVRIRWFAETIDVAGLKIPQAEGP